MRVNWNNHGNLVLTVPVFISFAFLVGFFYVPIAKISAEAFVGQEGWFYNFQRILSKPTTISAFSFTLIQASLSTMLSVILGLPIAYILTKFRIPAKSLIRSTIMVPFILPGIVVGLGFLFLFGENGLIPTLLATMGFGLSRYDYAFIGIIFAHAYYNSPLVAIMVESLWRRMDPEIEDAAEVLGVYGFSKFIKVTLPNLIPAILTSSILVFIFCFTSFEVVLLLGGFRYRTIEVEIYRLFMSFLDFSGASALSLIQLFFTLILTAIYIFFLDRYTDVKKTARAQMYPEKKILERNIVNVSFLILFIGYLAFEIFPIVIVFIYSLIDPVRDVFTLTGYLEFFSTRYNPYLGGAPILAPFNTIVFSTLTAILALLMGISTAYFVFGNRRRSSLLTILMILPLATSKITLAIGLILSFGSLGIIYTDPRILIIASHVVIAYPFSTRAIFNGLTRLDPEITEAAEVLGADPIKRIILVDMPLLSPSLAVAASLSFAVSLGEFAATNILYGGTYPTITVAIFVFLGGRRFTASAAGATILVLVSVAIFYVISRYSEDLSSGFS